MYLSYECSNKQQIWVPVALFNYSYFLSSLASFLCNSLLFRWKQQVQLVYLLPSIAVSNATSILMIKTQQYIKGPTQ